MKKLTTNRTGIMIIVVLFLFCIPLSAQVPKPSDVFGFEVGADYELISYDKMLTYFDQLANTSDRVKKIEIGKSTNGRPMLLLMISSKENLARLDHWQDISKKLARARIGEAEASKLAKEGKAIVWIDGGMHANELAHGQMTPLLAYRVATEDTDEMKKIRDNVVLLLMPQMNPDGLDMWHSWYYKHLNTPYETSDVPWLWQEYVGHDNNRDWFMANMVETQNVMKLLFEDWYPQVVYNHHQPGQEAGWERIFIPPFRSPVNPNIPSEVTAGVNALGAAMLERFGKENMPGVLNSYVYSMFWNGGMRTAPYYHNMIGILSETVHGSPTPRYYDPKDKPDFIPNTDISTDGTSIAFPSPWEGGWSHFRDAVDYMYEASIAVLDYAADRREHLLNGIYKMGRKSIETGEKEAPYAYVIPGDQWDTESAENMVNILHRGGVEVYRATKNFTADGQQFPAGTYIAYTAQAFRPYLVDLMEPQNYPNLYEYPGGPPKVPYDLAGWTLPMQFGLDVRKIKTSFKADAAAVTDFVKPQTGKILGKGTYGYLLDSKSNSTARIVNELFKNGAQISRTTAAIKSNGTDFSAGAYVISGVDKAAIQQMAETYGIDFTALSADPEVTVKEIKAPKVGLYKSHVANIDEGWTRWLLQNQYGFDTDSLLDKDMQTEDLSRYSSIVIPSQNGTAIHHGHSIREMPEEYTGGMGQKGVSALIDYVEKGGTLIAFDEAADFVIQQFGLPVKNIVSKLKSTDFFIPGSLIKTSVDTANPLAWGMQKEVSASFQRSRAFSIDQQFMRGHGGKVNPDPALDAGTEVVAKYASDPEELLMSGWMLGGKYIADKPALVTVPYGKGRIVLFAFRPQFRGQTHATYKLIFNALFNATNDSL